MRLLAAWLPAMILSITGCGEQPAAGPDAGIEAGPVAQGSPARGDLAVNEVSPRPETGPDWIELVNRTESPIDLCGYFVTDDLDRLDHYAPLGGAPPPGPCDPVFLDPGEYLVIVADDDREAGPDHAPFRLGPDDQVHVVSADGIAVDSLLFLYPAGERRATLARTPDSEGLFYLAEPTPGAPNPGDMP